MDRGESVWLEVHGGHSWFTIRRTRDNQWCRRCGGPIEKGNLYAVNNYHDSQDAWRDTNRCLDCAQATRVG